MKRRQRTGLPIYPSEICFQTLNENQGNEEFGTFSQHHNLSTISNFEIPAVEFKYLERNQQLYTQTIRDIPQTSLLDIPAINLLEQGLNPSYSGKSVLSTFYPSKRFRGSESLYPSLNAPVYDVAPGGIQYQNDGLVLIAQSFALPSAYENNSNSDHPPFSSSIHGYHSALNGNSSSEPGWVMKLELPSFQTQTGNRGSPSSPLPPSLECVDTLIQTTQTENTQSCSLSPRNSGLLDSVLCESQNIKHSKNNSCEQTSHASVMAIDVMDTSPHDLLDTQWEAYGDPISPLGHSSFSFREYTIGSRNPLDEPQSVETMTGCYVKEVVEPVPMQYNNTETANLMIFSRPDFLLGSSNCFVPNNDQTREHSLLKDAFGQFRVEDLSRDCKQMDSGTTSSAKKCGA